MKNRLWIIFVAGTFLCLNGTLLHAHPRFDVTDLGPISTLTDQGSQPTVQYYSLNNAGQIVGVRLPDYDVFIWQNGQTTDLGIQGTPVKINDSGQVVINSNSEAKVFLWENGTVTDLATTFGEAAIKALFFNNNGQVLLRYHPHIADAPVSYKIWKNGSVTDIAGIPTDISVGIEPNNMNNLGEVLFWVKFISGSGNVFDIHLYLWKDNGVTDMGLIKAVDFNLNFPVNEPYVFPMNDSRQIVLGRTLWQDNQSIVLDIFPAFINNNGQILGRYVDLNSKPTQYLITSEFIPVYYPVFWEEGVFRHIAELVDNVPPDLSIDSPIDFNDNGQILFHGQQLQVQTADSRLGFIRHALLLSPNGQTDTNDPPAQGCGQYLPFLIGLLVLGVKGLSFTAGRFENSTYKTF